MHFLSGNSCFKQVTYTDFKLALTCLYLCFFVHLLVIVGNEVWFLTKTNRGDPDYTKFWKRYLAYPTRSTFSSTAEGMNIIKEERRIAHLNDGTIRNYLKDNPAYNEDLQYFAKQRPFWGGLILNKNSPLTEAFNQAIAKNCIIIYQKQISS